MSQWKMDDSAANSVLWSPTSVKQAPTRTNANLLFGNTTANAYTDTGETIGMYGVDTAELTYDEYKLSGVTIGSSRGNNVLLTGNATTGYQVNGGTASVNAIINVDSLAVVSAAVNAAGNSYVNGDIVEISGSGTGSHARFTVTANATGNVTAVTLISGYEGRYTVFPTNTAAATSNISGSGAGLTLVITAGVGDVSISNAGTFTALPSADDNAVTEQAAQANTTTTLNLKFTKSNIDTGGPGWVITKELAGNKAGRVQTEILVAGRSMTGDAEDAQFPNTS